MSIQFEGLVGSAAGLKVVPVPPGPQSVAVYDDGLVLGDAVPGRTEGPIGDMIASVAVAIGFPADGWKAAMTFGPATVEPVRFVVTALVLAFGCTEVLLLCLC
ncbi:MAG: hypothetical protein AAFP17_13680 [Pseudomonadota bacterium]